MKYKNKWYKVWYIGTFYTGEQYVTFEYAHGDRQVKKMVYKLKAFKVTEV